MHSKIVAVLFLSTLAAGAAVGVEERQYGSSSGSSDSGDAYYNSLMSELNSMATDTNYMDFLTAYTNIPTDYSAALPVATGSSFDSGSGSGSGSGTNSNANTMPGMTAAPTVSMPSGMPAVDMPPPSIESVLITAVPTSWLSQMANPTSASSIFSEIQHGHFPSWYQQLPSSVKEWLTSHYATATAAMATGASSGSSSSGSGGAPHGNGASTGVLATGLMGAAGVLAVAVML